MIFNKVERSYSLDMIVISRVANIMNRCIDRMITITQTVNFHCVITLIALLTTADRICVGTGLPKMAESTRRKNITSPINIISEVIKSDKSDTVPKHISARTMRIVNSGSSHGIIFLTERDILSRCTTFHTTREYNAETRKQCEDSQICKDDEKHLVCDG